MQFQIGSRLVYQVDCLVGQEAVHDVLGTGMDSILQGFLTVGDAVEFLVFLLQSFQYLDGFLLIGFLDVYLLEPAHDALALGDVAVVFLVGGGSDESDVSALQVFLEHIGGIGSAVRSPTRSYYIMYLVEVDDGVAFLGCAFHDHLDASLEVTAVLCARQHLRDVHTVDSGSLETLWHLALVDQSGESVDQCRLAHARFADV